VIFRLIYDPKAILALVAGMAFFGTGCQPKVTVKTEPPAVTQEADLFAEAEALWDRGEMDQALARYHAYLQQGPHGERRALALFRVAQIHLQQGRDDEALAQLKTLKAEFPDLPQMDQVRYLMADLLQRKGQYRAARDEAVSWLRDYPEHKLRKEVLLIAANADLALENRKDAFSWLLTAKNDFPEDAALQSDLSERLLTIVRGSDPDELEEMAHMAAGAPLLPEIYLRMARLYLEKGDLDGARRAAMSLVRATPETSYVSEGRRILERVESERSVNKTAVGCLLPLSGPFAIYGQEVLNGMALGMGLFGDTPPSVGLELLIRDTQGEPEKTVASLEALVSQEKVIAVVGPLASKNAAAAASRAQALGVPLITLTQKESITLEGDMVFRNFLTQSKEVRRILDCAMEEMGLTRFAVLYPDDAFGRNLMNLFVDRVQQMGGVVTAVESYNPEETDFAEQIKRMTGRHGLSSGGGLSKTREMWSPEMEERRIHPEEPAPMIDFDAVFIPDHVQQVIMIAPQLLYHDVRDVLLMGTSLWHSPELLQEAGDYVQGAIFTAGFFSGSDDPRVARFVRDYTEAFGAAPGMLAATGYDTIQFLLELMSTGEIRTRNGLDRSILDHQGFEGVTGDLSFDGDGEVTKAPLVLRVSGKTFVQYAPAIEAKPSGPGQKP
jgi:branched-chain amino acid transport system substrate-binding protein